MSIVGQLLAWLVDLAGERFGSRSSGAAILALIAANLVPVAGVLFFGWNVWTILALYWLENGIVGLFNLPKLLLARGPISVRAGRGVAMTMPIRLPSAARVVAIPFFTFHYGMFWLVHGLFVLVGLPSAAAVAGGRVNVVPSPVTLGLAALALFVSHGVSFRTNFLGAREYERRSIAHQMIAPYGRVIMLHVTLVLGGIVVSLTGAPIVLLLVLVVVKTALDLQFHLREHASDSAAGARRRPRVGDLR